MKIMFKQCPTCGSKSLEEVEDNGQFCNDCGNTSYCNLIIVDGNL